MAVALFGALLTQTPAAPAETPVSVTAIGVSGSSSCAIVVDGGLKCWGDNTQGQLGYGDTNHRGDNPGEMGNNLPYVDLGTGRTATSVSGEGAQHTCAVLDNGHVKCWGYNIVGQLGYGDTNNRGDEPGEMGNNLPYVDLGTGRTATAITVGNFHTCVVLDNGHVKCWGYNNYGHLGYGDVDRRGDDPNEMGDNLPYIDLGTGRTATAITASAYNTCAVLDNGQTKCWGDNTYGQLGYGDLDRRGDDPNEMGDNLPYIDLGTNLTALGLEAGDAHTCALVSSQRVKCWGFNGRGQLGYGDMDSRGDNPGEMGDNLDVVNIAAGSQLTVGNDHACVRFPNATVRCWGDNDVGQLGYGDRDPRGDNPGEMGDNLPAVLLGSGTPVTVAAGHLHSCALLDNGRVKCWGHNRVGQLGLGDAKGRGDQPGEMGDNLAYVDLGTITTTTMPPVMPPVMPPTTPGTTDPCPPGGTPFTDIGSSFARDDIACIYQLGITTGTSPTTYDPKGDVTREQMAAFLGRLVANCPPDTDHGFTDVDPTSFADTHISCLKAFGVTTGTSATTYSPEDNVTREQMAAFIARMWRATDTACPTGGDPFTDIAATSFARNDISCIYRLGITTGTSATTYDPNGTVTREQMAAFLARFLRAYVDR